MLKAKYFLFLGMICILTPAFAVSASWQTQQKVCNAELIERIKQGVDHEPNFSERLTPDGLGSIGFSRRQTADVYIVTARSKNSGQILARAECVVKRRSDDIVAFKMTKLALP